MKRSDLRTVIYSLHDKESDGYFHRFVVINYATSRSDVKALIETEKGDVISLDLYSFRFTS